MQKLIASGRGIRWAFVSLVAAGVVSTAGATPAAAQVFEGNLFLRTQAEVDAFSYTEVTGQLGVFSSDADPVTNLDGLSSLTKVGDFFHVRSSRLTNVDGLSSLTSVGAMVFQYNRSLTNVDGLSNLTQVEGELALGDNQLLRDVDGLSSLTSVGALRLYMTSLTNVDGLSSLTSVGHLGFEYNYWLRDVDGLSSLTSAESLLFEANTFLTNVDGLSSITSVGNLNISYNGSLTDFCGLYPLLAADGLGGYYYVNNNAVNPNQQQILDGGPCDPADTIMELFDAGAITMAQAEVLLHLADNNLEGLAGILMGFVESGFLTPVEGQLLFVIAFNWQAAI